MYNNSAQLNAPQRKTSTRSFSKRFSNLCMKLAPSSSSKQTHQKAKIKISYPLHVQSSAPISLSPHRSRYHSTSAERRPLSNSSLTCAGLGEEVWEPPEASRREYYVPAVHASGEWVPPPGTNLRTDELCRVCDRRPVRNGAGICNKCRSCFNLTSGYICHMISMLMATRKIGTPALDTPGNRLSQWTISDYYRDSFVQSRPDTPPAVATHNTSRQHHEQGDGESIQFRHSYYEGLFNDNEAHQPEDAFAFDRNRRWSRETEDVPDRHQSYRERANQQFEQLDDQIYFHYDNLFEDYDSQQPETVASIALRIARRQGWSEESDREDMPDRRLTFRRQQSEDLPPARGRNLRWSEETEDVPDRHPRYRRY